MKVKLSKFRKPVVHKHVKDVVFGKDGEGFHLGFLPEEEFAYEFADGAPDVFSQSLDIEDVYYEPYRTFLRLKLPINIELYWLGEADKLYVKGLK